MIDNLEIMRNIKRRTDKIVRFRKIAQFIESNRTVFESPIVHQWLALYQNSSRNTFPNTISTLEARFEDVLELASPADQFTLQMLGFKK